MSTGSVVLKGLVVMTNHESIATSLCSFPQLYKVLVSFGLGF